jgi:hypothetical protein
MQEKKEEQIVMNKNKKCMSAQFLFHSINKGRCWKKGHPRNRRKVVLQFKKGRKTGTEALRNILVNSAALCFAMHCIMLHLPLILEPVFSDLIPSNSLFCAFHFFSNNFFGILTNLSDVFGLCLVIRFLGACAFVIRFLGGLSLSLWRDCGTLFQIPIAH